MLIAKCFLHQLPKHWLHVELGNRFPQRIIFQILSFGQGGKNCREHGKKLRLLNLTQHCENL